MTGCSSAQPTAGVGATCGSTHTAAGVPVIIKVAKGSVNCQTAMQVENEYAAKIKAGQVPGNGGGAPIPITCDRVKASPDGAGWQEDGTSGRSGSTHHDLARPPEVPLRSQSATTTITRAVTVAAGVFAPVIWAN